MGKIKASRPSPTIVIAVLALVAALAGTAIARPGAKTSGLSQGNVKKIAKKQINKLAPGLSVAHAASADNANNAASADHAASADNANNADNAANANNLGGQPASAYQQRVRWALVDAGGNIVAQSGGITMSSHSAGDYYLDFGSSLANKAIVATASEKFTDVGRVGVETAVCGGGPAGATCPSPDDANHAYVLTTKLTLTSGSQPEGFYIAVIG
jgi:hypothetical protein